MIHHIHHLYSLSDQAFSQNKVCAVIHCMLHNDYMQVEQGPNGRWKPVAAFKRYWQKDMWATLFDRLLNIPDCERLPPLAMMRGAVEQFLYETQERKLSLQRALHKQNMMLYDLK